MQRASETAKNVLFFIEPPPCLCIRVCGNSLGNELNIQDKGDLRQEEKDHNVGFPLLARQLHIQRNPESDRSLRALIDTAITIPAGLRIRDHRKTAFRGAEVDILGADVYALAALFAFVFINNRRHSKLLFLYFSPLGDDFAVNIFYEKAAFVEHRIGYGIIPADISSPGFFPFESGDEYQLAQVQ